MDNEKYNSAVKLKGGINDMDKAIMQARSGIVHTNHGKRFVIEDISESELNLIRGVVEEYLYNRKAQLIKEFENL